MTEKYEVIVVGGGAAGLPAALVLGRAQHRVGVVGTQRTQLWHLHRQVAMQVLWTLQQVAQCQ